MRVFFYNDNIINCTEGDPQIEWLVSSETREAVLNEDGAVIEPEQVVKSPAEEIPAKIFGDYAHLADDTNTRKENGEWIFDFDVAAYEAEETEQQADMVRKERDRLLAQCDWTQMPDAPLTADAKAQWQAYRQALRDVPEQEGFPMAVEWPESSEG